MTDLAIRAEIDFKELRESTCLSALTREVAVLQSSIDEKDRADKKVNQADHQEQGREINAIIQSYVKIDEAIYALHESLAFLVDDSVHMTKGGEEKAVASDSDTAAFVKQVRAMARAWTIDEPSKARAGYAAGSDMKKNSSGKEKDHGSQGGVGDAMINALNPDDTTTMSIPAPSSSEARREDLTAVLKTLGVRARSIIKECLTTRLHSALAARSSSSASGVDIDVARRGVHMNIGPGTDMELIMDVVELMALVMPQDQLVQTLIAHRYSCLCRSLSEEGVHYTPPVAPVSPTVIERTPSKHASQAKVRDHPKARAPDVILCGEFPLDTLLSAAVKGVACFTSFIKQQLPADVLVLTHLPLFYPATDGAAPSDRDADGGQKSGSGNGGDHSTDNRNDNSKDYDDGDGRDRGHGNSETGGKRNRRGDGPGGGTAIIWETRLKITKKQLHQLYLSQMILYMRRVLTALVKRGDKRRQDRLTRNEAMQHEEDKEAKGGEGARVCFPAEKSSDLLNSGDGVDNGTDEEDGQEESLGILRSILVSIREINEEINTRFQCCSFYADQQSSSPSTVSSSSSPSSPPPSSSSFPFFTFVDVMQACDDKEQKELFAYLDRDILRSHVLAASSPLPAGEGVFPVLEELFHMLSLFASPSSFAGASAGAGAGAGAGAALGFNSSRIIGDGRNNHSGHNINQDDNDNSNRICIDPHDNFPAVRKLEHKLRHLVFASIKASIHRWASTFTPVPTLSFPSSSSPPRSSSSLSTTRFVSPGPIPAAATAAAERRGRITFASSKTVVIADVIRAVSNAMSLKTSLAHWQHAYYDAPASSPSSVARERGSSSGFRPELNSLIFAGCAAAAIHWIDRCRVMVLSGICRYHWSEKRDVSYLPEILKPKLHGATPPVVMYSVFLSGVWRDLCTHLHAQSAHRRRGGQGERERKGGEEKMPKKTESTEKTEMKEKTEKTEMKEKTAKTESKQSEDHYTALVLVHARIFGQVLLETGNSLLARYKSLDVSRFNKRQLEVDLLSLLLIVRSATLSLSQLSGLLGLSGLDTGSAADAGVWDSTVESRLETVAIELLLFLCTTAADAEDVAGMLACSLSTTPSSSLPPSPPPSSASSVSPPVFDEGWLQVMVGRCCRFVASRSSGAAAFKSRLQRVWAPATTLVLPPLWPWCSLSSSSAALTSPFSVCSLNHVLGMGASVGSAGGDCRKDGNDGNDAIDGGEESDGKNIGRDDTEDAVGSSVDDGGSCSSFEDLMAIKLPYREILCALLADSLLPASPSSSSSSSLSARAQLSPLLHLVSKHHILRADDYPVLSEKDAKTKNKLETIIDRLTSR